MTPKTIETIRMVLVAAAVALTLAVVLAPGHVAPGPVLLGIAFGIMALTLSVGWIPSARANDDHPLPASDPAVPTQYAFRVVIGGTNALARSETVLLFSVATDREAMDLCRLVARGLNAGGKATVYLVSSEDLPSNTSQPWCDAFATWPVIVAWERSRASLGYAVRVERDPFDTQHASGQPILPSLCSDADEL